MRGSVWMLVSSFEDEGMRILVVSMTKSPSDLNSIAAEVAAFFMVGEDEDGGGGEEIID